MKSGLKFPDTFFVYLIGIILVPTLVLLFMKYKSATMVARIENPSLVNDSGIKDTEVNIESSSSQ